MIHKSRYSTSTSKKTTSMSECRKPFLCGASGNFCSESEVISVSPWLSNKNVRCVLAFFVLRRNEHFERTPGGELYEGTDGHATRAGAQSCQCLTTELEEKLA